MIRFEAVTKRYANGREALTAASFHLNPGEMVFLTGHSGAGKSTLLKLVAAIERPTRGTVIINRLLPHQHQIGLLAPIDRCENFRHCQ